MARRGSPTGGLNAIVRVDPETRRVRRFPLPSGRAAANLNTATFDDAACSGLPARAASTAGSTRRSGRVRVFDAPGGPGPYGIATTPAATCTTPRSPVATSAGSTSRPARRPCCSRRRPTRARAGSGRTRRAGSGSASGTPASSRGTTRRPGRGASGGYLATRPQPYAVYVDERDAVWLSDFGANALVRFDPRTERFTTVALPSTTAEVRQLLGREGEVWGAESGVDKLVVVRPRR